MKENNLTFATLREANLARLPLFTDRQGRRCHTAPDGSDWLPAEWVQATVGELGELANLLKKVRRGDFTRKEALPEIERELADVVTYLDILALQFGVDLGKATTSKFNEVSNRIGVPVFINGDAIWPMEQSHDD
jgi:NTP pyrophosphatase (non-canonical NTP hydrolase)